jgi:hypothetical protein
MMNFGQNWDDWRGSLLETINAAREIDPSDDNVISVVEDMIDFLAQRVCPGSPEEEIIADLWDRASAKEREAIAKLFLRMIERAPTVSP